MEALWTPSDERVVSTRLEGLRCAAEGRAGRELPDSRALWSWSVSDPGAFWRLVWDDAGVVGDPGDRLVEAAEEFWRWRFLPDATLNVAENLLAPRPGAGEVAIEAWREDGMARSLTWDELRRDVAALAAAFVASGVQPGDRVAAWMPNIAETVVAMCAAASIGAVFTSTSADFGVTGVVDRFGQTEPVVLVAADGYRYGGRDVDCLERLREITAELPSVRTTLVVGYLDARPDVSGVAGARLWDEVLDEHRGAEPEPARLPFDHPLYVLYSSGTTGKPKCIIHRAGGVLLKHLCEQQYHGDIRAGDRVLYFTTCGWMMWNWLVSVLANGATIVLYDGNPAFPDQKALFDVADHYDLTLLGVSAKYIDGVMKSGLRPADTHRLSSLRSVLSTGSPLSHEAFGWVYDAVKSDVHLASISGGTDLCGCLVLGDPTRAVYAGEIQSQALGLGIEVFDDDGRPLAPGVKGELVCTVPFPSVPLGFWGDEDDRRYRSAYFERFPGVWAHGDYAAWTERGGMIIFGRSDATLNASGVRIGTAEIYRVVENLPQVVEALAIGQEWEGDTRIVLFVRLSEGSVLDDELRSTIRSQLRNRCSPRHVPAVIAEVADIPRTRSGKIVELAVTDVVHGRPVKNREALANPEALELFADHPALG